MTSERLAYLARVALTFMALGALAYLADRYVLGPIRPHIMPARLPK